MTPRFSQKALVIGILAAAYNATATAQVEPQIEEISVIGQFVPDEKRGTDQVANVVGEEQFTRSGDANIAESLKRISGLSTVGGKFVYVRGLGERYSTTLLNGAILPSPEPINRVVPMDLFPTAVLDSVLVQKTYSAAFPSEFGGGVLQLRTKKSTDEFFWNVTSTVGAQDNTSFKNGFVLDGGDTDWLGYDDGHRAPSSVLQQAVGDGEELRQLSRFTGVGVSPEELQAIGRSFNNEYIADEEALPADVSFSTSLGNFHEIGDNGAKVNYFGSVNYSNTWDTNEIERNTYVPSSTGLTQQEGMNFKGTENSIDVSAIFSAGLDFNPNHNVRATSIMLRKTDDRLSRSNGFTEAETNLQVAEVEWIERELFSNQLQGDHYFPEFNELVVNWRYSHIKAERDAPDNRIYRYDSGELSSRVDGNLRNFSVLDDTVDDFGIDFTMVFYGPLNSVITTQAGYVYSEKERESEIRRYGFAFNGAIANDAELLVRPIEEILTAENIQPNGFQIREITRPTDNYAAENELEAYYGEVEFNFDERFRFTLGARQEDFNQRADTFDLFRPDVSIASTQAKSELLPAFSATYIHYDHQFRAAYSETVSRPDFRELSPAAFTNPTTGKEVVGNPNLRITSIKNYDLRWEWYFDYTDYMSLGVFYKEFTDPIEAAIQSPVTRRSTFINATNAENAGIEWELFKRLDFLGDDFLNGIGEDFYIQTNISYIDSEVNIAEEDRGSLTSTTRALQGQSDWLFNAQLGYEPFSGTTATLLYHYYGERIAEVGIEGAPDLIEDPFGELNLVFIRELNDNWKITAKGKNLTDEKSMILQGGFLTTGFNLGRQFSLQVDYTF